MRRKLLQDQEKARRQRKDYLFLEGTGKAYMIENKGQIIAHHHTVRESSLPGRIKAREAFRGNKKPTRFVPLFLNK